ncbi:MAG: hypothetical protein EA423_12485 [Phycisphaerales bacterium]|nr:MAG: hypothetical protein EA423_12485 [Phycisphaerales bacterium]
MQIFRKYPIAGVVLAGLCLTGAAFAMMRTTMKKAPPERPAYFIDLNTERIFVAGGDTSPVRAPSGRLPDGGDAGFRAYIYTCDQPFDARGLTLEQLRNKGGDIAYISMYTPESREAQVELRGTAFSDEDLRLYDLMKIIRAGHLIRSLDSEAWVQADSEEAYKLEMAPHDRCDGLSPTQLSPQRR